MNLVAFDIATVTSSSFSRLNPGNRKASNDFEALLSKSKAPKLSQQKGVDEAVDVKANKTEYQRTEKNRSKKVEEPVDSQPVEEEKDVQKITKNLIKKLAKAMGISEEDLSSVMASLNLTVMDLFKQDGLGAVLTEVLGSVGEVELLTNENKLNEFKMLQNILNETANRLGLDIEGNDFEQLLKELQLATQLDENQTTDVQVQPEQLLEAEPQSVMSQATTQSTSQSAPQSTTIEIEDLSTLKEEMIPVENTENPQQSQDNEGSSGAEQKFNPIFMNAQNTKFELKTEIVNGFNLQQIPAKEIFDQIVTQAKITLTDKATTMVMQLNPENLGKVALSIASENGSITGQFVAENQSVKEAIEMNLTTLKANLVEQGIKVDEIKVIIGNTAQFFEKNEANQNSQHQSKNRRRKISIEALEDIETKMQNLQESLRALGLEEQHSVEYSA